MLIDYEQTSKVLKEMKSSDPISKWMTPNPQKVLPDQSLREVIQILEQHRIDGLPVINEERKVVGLITKSRLMRCFVEGISPDVPVYEVMKGSVVTIGENETIETASRIPVGRLPVINEDGKLSGILTRTDILHSYSSHIDELQETIHSTSILHTILETAYEGIAVIDTKGIICEFNEAYARFLGKKREEAIGQHVTSIIENTRLHHVIQTGVAEKGYIQRIQGQDMVVHRIPIRRDGEVVGAIGMLIFQGVTELYNILGRMQELTRQVTQNRLPQDTASQQEGGFTKIIGNSEELQHVKRIARKAAGTPSTVLITGESGTGKEMFANAIHTFSPYAEGPFISVNCAAIPEHLLEAELFGYEEGAFTGAKKGGKPGKFELAHKGTLFLDEIGDMPALMQSKILRVLQEREVERVGGLAKHQVDVRIVAATNRRLEEMVREGDFREDLYYRLNIIRLEIPPLRERKEDISHLLDYQLHQFCERFGLEEKWFSEEAMNALISYSWPGNVRELVNTVEMLVSLSDSNMITLDELPARIMSKRVENPLSAEVLEEKVEAAPLTRMKTSALEQEKELIVRVLIETNGNKAAAARKLGIQRSTLYEKLKKHNIH
ncbi:sigma-54-dependent Fis family transcriptional regulator [Peribacillus deserti]|uniref:Sigma-54-dependent Fis family transcriptional regulator n=1 Tax=Peribacillus deserti TaxID=673318 RepID=A0A2N5M6Q1_9BACI|nr:sigma-54-dependent Fis family transcriptional regulator [Peribacillus deserti]PLT30048.1 sigma-54-dependent Fis family transcriptional regulator [Peribacillus deserti]